MFHVKHMSTGTVFEITLGYSRAVVKRGWCFISGVTGYDYATMEMPNRVSNLARSCFATIDDVFQQAGFARDVIVRLQ
jgi:enamine deaminase RidA (YjgF/YER057c/UK114 family)